MQTCVGYDMGALVYCCSTATTLGRQSESMVSAVYTNVLVMIVKLSIQSKAKQNVTSVAITCLRW